MFILKIHFSTNKYKKLKTLAQHQGISVTELMEELSNQALIEFDAETRFRGLASIGEPERGLELLDKLDTFFTR